jgi:hypothetical protein
MDRPLPPNAHLAQYAVGLRPDAPAPNPGRRAAAYFMDHYDNAFQNPGGRVPGAQELAAMYPTHQEIAAAQAQRFRWIPYQHPPPPPPPPPAAPPVHAAPAQIEDVPEEAHDPEDLRKSESQLLRVFDAMLTVVRPCCSVPTVCS